MELTHVTSQNIRHLISLTERREELIKLIAEIENETVRVLEGRGSETGSETILRFKENGVEVVQILGSGAIPSAPKAAAKGKLFAGNAPMASLERGVRGVGKSAIIAGGRNGQRKGGLKERILDLLASVGPEGLRVKEIAAKLGKSPQSVSVWFSTVGKKLTTKIEPGRFAAKGGVSAVEPAAAAKMVLKPAKVRRKRKMSAEGRARIGAAAKARWAARRAAK